MSDEEQIRRVLALSMHYADDRNARGRSDLCAADARYYPSSGEVVGRADIYESMAGRSGSLGQDRKSKHMSTWEVAQVGRYLDGFVRSGDTWLFSANRIVTL